jgi:hypothetical protein
LLFPLLAVHCRTRLRLGDRSFAIVDGRFVAGTGLTRVPNI